MLSERPELVRRLKSRNTILKLGNPVASGSHTLAILLAPGPQINILRAICVETSELSEKEKRADLAGPGIGSYEELEKILPRGYSSILDPKDAQSAVFDLKNYIERNLCRELNLMMVQVPLIVDAESGVNDLLDRDLSRTPVQFHISNDRDKHPVDAQTLRKQLEISGQLDFLKFPHHQGIIGNDLPFSIGGGIGQAATYMLLLKKAHLGEVTVSVWPKILKDMCERRNIHIIE